MEATHGNPDEAGTSLDPVSVRVAEEDEEADARCGKELQSEDGIDFADELVTDIDCCFGDVATKL